jgi:hypothetical protein
LILSRLPAVNENLRYWVLLALGLGLLVAPYLAGTDFGQIKIPNLSDRAKRISRVLGPVAFFVSLSLFIPFLPPSGSTAPTHYVDTDAGFINLRKDPITRDQLKKAGEQDTRTGTTHETILMQIWNNTQVTLLQELKDDWYRVKVRKGCEIREGVVSKAFNGRPTLRPMSNIR